MKGYNLTQTILVIAIIIVVCGFGAYAVTNSLQKVTSKVAFNVVDTNLNVKLQAQFSMVGRGIIPTGEPNDPYTFATQTTANGLSNGSWDMPNIVFAENESSSEGDAVVNAKEAHIILVVSNMNTIKNVKITISGVALDNDNIMNMRRYSVQAQAKDAAGNFLDSNGAPLLNPAGEPIKANETNNQCFKDMIVVNSVANTNYEFILGTATKQDIDEENNTYTTVPSVFTIDIKFELERSNASFKAIENNIQVTLESVDVSIPQA